MSSIVGITPNIQPKKQPLSRLAVGKNPSFTRKGLDLTKPFDTLVEEAVVKGYLGRYGKVMNYLSEKVGEIQNILFIGVGTAFVAPIFIAFNPIAKQDKKTKEYSALRQPISAVITTAVGLGINMPVAAAVEKWAVEGRVKEFDTSAKPSKDYLSARYKNILKYFGNLKNEADKKFFAMLPEDKVKTKEDFHKNYGNYSSFEKDIHDVTLKQEALKLLDKNNPEGLRNIKLRDFLISQLGFEVDPIDNSILNVDVAKSKLKNTTALKFLKTFGYSDKEVDEGKLRAFMNENFYKKEFVNACGTDKKYAEAFFDAFRAIADKNDISISDLPEVQKLITEKLSKKGFESAERKTITRLAENLISEELKNKETISTKNLFKVLCVDEFAETAKNCGQKAPKLHENTKLLNMTVAEFLQKLHESLKIDEAVSSAKKVKEAVKVKEFEAFLLDHTKEIAKNFAGAHQTNFKAYKSVQGIFLSLLVLPFSCGALNWAYPRIMEKLFPSLVSDKDSKQTNSKGGQ